VTSYVSAREGTKWKQTQPGVEPRVIDDGDDDDDDNNDA